MSDERNVLTLSQISKRYESGEKILNVLTKADLHLYRGEMVALVAPSGGGKTTLLQIAGLLDSPDEGEVFILGEDASTADDQKRTQMRRHSIGFVYQFHHLLPEFSAIENVLLPQLASGLHQDKARERALQLLDYLQIAHRADHRPAELSGGEQQRVAIARSVANAPSILLADEPTGNLDPLTSERVFQALTALVRQSGLATLIATHNRELAQKMDRIITIDQGKIISL